MRIEWYLVCCFFFTFKKYSITLKDFLSVRPQDYLAILGIRYPCYRGYFLLFHQIFTVQQHILNNSYNFIAVWYSWDKWLKNETGVVMYEENVDYLKRLFVSIMLIVKNIKSQRFEARESNILQISAPLSPCVPYVIADWLKHFFSEK